MNLWMEERVNDYYYRELGQMGGHGVVHLCLVVAAAD